MIKAISFMVHYQFALYKIHKQIRGVGSHGPVGPTKFCLIRKTHAMNQDRLVRNVEAKRRVERRRKEGVPRIL